MVILYTIGFDKMSIKYYEKNIQTNLSLRDIEFITFLIAQTLYMKQSDDIEDKMEFAYRSKLYREFLNLEEENKEQK